MADLDYDLMIYRDQYEGAAGIAISLDAPFCVLYISTGSIIADGVEYTAGDGIFLADTPAFELVGNGVVELIRWVLLPAGETTARPVPETGKSVLLRADRIHLPSNEVVVRHDVVTFPPGTRAYKHIHAAPGIRYLLRGTLEINNDHSRYLMDPGHAWFEGVNEPVLAIAAEDVESQFARVQILPTEYLGKPTITYVDPADDTKPREQTNDRRFDEEVRL